MSLIEVKVPDIGDFQNIPVIEIQVKPGDDIKADDPLITLESDKAAMEIPAPIAGRIAAVLVQIGDKVSRGSAILQVDTAGTTSTEANGAPLAAKAGTSTLAAQATHDGPQQGQPNATLASKTDNRSADGTSGSAGNIHASPSVRMIAREFNIDLATVTPTGDKGRITKEDVKRQILQRGGGHQGTVNGIPEIPAQDFSKFGAIEIKPLSRIKKLSGPHLHRAWLNIPHVTHSDDADITDLEAYRRILDDAAKAKGYRVTMIAFLLKASVSALKEFPEINASLDASKEALILKKFYNIGVAVDTPDGLVVPVIKDVDRKGILELSQELAAVSERMRAGRIAPADIQGGTFSISSLGGIGGTNFTPIVNSPEVAILGAARAMIKPVWDGTAFQPRLMLPLCLSFDHRVIDGALAARFLRKLAESLGDVRQLVL